MMKMDTSSMKSPLKVCERRTSFWHLIQGIFIISGRDAGAQVEQSCTPSTAKHSESWTRKTRRSSFEAEDIWSTKLRHDWAIPLEQLANRSHRRDTQHFNLQEQTQNISIQTVSPGRIETLHQLHEHLCDGLAIKKRYTNVLYITLHYIII